MNQKRKPSLIYGIVAWCLVPVIYLFCWTSLFSLGFWYFVLFVGYLVCKKVDKLLE